MYLTILTSNNQYFSIKYQQNDLPNTRTFFSVRYQLTYTQCRFILTFKGKKAEKEECSRFIWYTVENSRDRNILRNVDIFYPHDAAVLPNRPYWNVAVPSSMHVHDRLTTAQLGPTGEAIRTLWTTQVTSRSSTAAANIFTIREQRSMS